MEKSLEQYFQNDQARQAQGLRKHLLFSFSSTATEGFYQRFNWKLYQKTMKLSELQNTEDAFIIRPLKHIPHLFSNFQIYIYLIQSFTTKFYPCWFQGASKTNIIWFDFMNVADVSSSHEHVFSYLSQGTCFKGNIASTAWKYVYHTFYFGFPFLYPVWNYHNQKCIQYHKCVWKGPTNVSMYCNNLAGVNC